MTHFLERWYALCKCTKFICKFCVLSSQDLSTVGNSVAHGGSCPPGRSCWARGVTRLSQWGLSHHLPHVEVVTISCGDGGCCGSEIVFVKHGTAAAPRQASRLLEHSNAALIFSLDQFLQPALEKFAIKIWSSWDGNFAFFHPSYSASTARQNKFLYLFEK